MKDHLIPNKVSKYTLVYIVDDVILNDIIKPTAIRGYGRFISKMFLSRVLCNE